MSKPYLSIIVPVTEDNLLSSMLGIMNADRLLQGAMFDYEILTVVSETDPVYGSMTKFVTAICNAKCIKVPGNKLSELLRSGLIQAGGVLRAIAFKNDFRFLEEFPDHIPLFKENDMIIGPKWEILSGRIVPQMLSAIACSPYQFQIIKEDVMPVVCSGVRSNGWDFFAESHMRLIVAEKSIKSVNSAVLPRFDQIADLQLWKDAAIIRIHYLSLRVRNFIWLMNKKFVNAYQSIISRY